jgi:hypothetical protein
MKYLKTLGLLAGAAVVLMAFASAASATKLTSPIGTTYTGDIKAEAESHTTLHASNGISVSCASFISGKVETHGTGVTAGGKIASLSFPNCTNGDAVHVKAAGSLEVHAINSDGNGTLTSSGTTIEVTDSSGVTCSYLTNATHIGELTHSNSLSLPTLHIASAKIPRHAGSILCGSTGTWTGSYRVTTPAVLYVDP